MNKHNIHEYWHLLEAMRAGKTLQKRDDYREWITYTDLLFDKPPEFYRIKPAPRRAYFCNGVEVPEPLAVAPDIGTEVFSALPGTDKLALVSVWDGSDLLEEMLSSECLYDTVKDAIARAKAMMILDVREL